MYLALVTERCSRFRLVVRLATLSAGAEALRYT